MRVMRNSVGVLFVLFALGLTGCLDRPTGPSSAEQLQQDGETIDRYLAQNNISAYTDKSGLRFTIQELGTGGFPPRVDQGIRVKYLGKFLDGTVFDPGGDGDATGVLNTFILGWQYGLSIWPVGTKGTLYVPSPLGYGNGPYLSIPANSILIFNVELKEVISSNAEKARLAADITTIDDFLTSHSIDAVKDSTGVRYVIKEPGTGPSPTWYQQVKFNYSGKILASGTEFFNGVATPTDTFDSRVVDFLNGMRLGLTKIGVGGKITLYIPSSLAFGTSDNSQSALPPNSNVIYDIDLTEILP